MTTWTHDALCLRATRWLRGTRGCNPVFAGLASCSEIPDAIGWDRSGGIVVECKTSRSDFVADRRKYFVWRHREHGWRHSSYRLTEKEAAEQNFEVVQLPRMGRYRFFMSEPGIVTEELLAKYAPDHGLLYVSGNIVRTIVNAPERQQVDLDSEVRYLRFAIINVKQPLSTPAEMERRRYLWDCSIANRASEQLPLEAAQTEVAEPRSQW